MIVTGCPEINGWQGLPEEKKRGRITVRARPLAIPRFFNNRLTKTTIARIVPDKNEWEYLRFRENAVLNFRAFCMM
jgi:hypothetical protein